jgi:hypothetical protein
MTNLKALLTNGVQRLKETTNNPDPSLTTEYRTASDHRTTDKQMTPGKRRSTLSLLGF